MMSRARNPRNRHNCIVLFECLHGQDFIVFDTETTGTDPDKDRIIELSAIKYRMDNAEMTETDRMDLFICPPFLMDEGAIKVHHITNEMLADKPTEEECFADIYGFFGEHPILVAHNAAFDLGFMTRMYERESGGTLKFEPQVVLDTLEMARDNVSYKDTDDYRLETMADMYGIEQGITFHSAISDVTVTARLLQCMYRDYKENDVDPGDEKLFIKYMYFFKGHNREQCGIRACTDRGTVYFNTIYKIWLSSDVDLEKVDIMDLENKVLEKTGLADMREFGRLTEKKFKDLKASRKREGVYL